MRLDKRMIKLLFALSLVSLLAACGGNPATVIPSPTPAQTETPPPAPTTAPAPTNTPILVAPSATSTVSTAVPSARIVVQLPDNSVQSIDLSGGKTLLYSANAPVDLLSIFPPGNAVGSAFFLPVGGQPSTAVRVDPSGSKKLDWIKGPLYGIAASSSRIAWGTADTGTSKTAAQIQISGLDGAGVKSAFRETFTGVPRVLRVMRWSPNGSSLYFGKEPLGLGGYILFAGLSNLWSLDVSTGKAKELVHESAPNAAVCIDDLTPDGKRTADHCRPKSMQVTDIASKATKAILPPSNVSQFGMVGGARFSPDGSQLAYALARGNQDDEQGWVAVADLKSNTSKLVATSPARDYFSAAGWLDAKTLVLQSSGQKAGVWTVGADGSNLVRLSDGSFLGIAPESQSQLSDCGTVRMLGPNPPQESSALQAEDCLWNAYKQGKNAKLVVVIRGVDTAETHTLSLESKSGKIQVTDTVEHTIVPARPMATQIYACASIDRRQDGLVFKACGGEGDFFVPVPSSK